MRTVAIAILLCSPAFATQYQYTFQEYDLTPLVNPATGDTVTGDILFWNGLIFNMQWMRTGSPGAGDLTLPDFTTFGGNYTLTDTQMILNANNAFNYSTPGGGLFQIVTDNTGQSQINASETWIQDLAVPYVFATYTKDVVLTFSTDNPDPIWPGTNPAGNGGLFPEGVVNPGGDDGGGGPNNPEPSTLVLAAMGAVGFVMWKSRRAA